MARRWSGTFLTVLLIIGQDRTVQSAKLGQRTVLSSGSSTERPDVDSFGFREFILRAGKERTLDFSNVGPEASISKIMPANLQNSRRRRMTGLLSQRHNEGYKTEPGSGDRSLASAEDNVASRTVDNERPREMKPAKLRSVAFEVHPTQTTMTFPIRGLQSLLGATLTLAELHPVARSPFPVVCHGPGSIVVAKMSAAEHLDLSAQPKIYTADVTACLRAARNAGVDEMHIEMALPCHQRCLFSEAPFLVLQ